MSKKILPSLTLAAVAAVVIALGLKAQADEFTEKDKERWQEEFMSVVNKGRELWTSP